jgi:hypothetical protein
MFILYYDPMKLRTSPVPKMLVADEAWIATALLHHEHPDREDFSVREILDRARAESPTGELREGVKHHVSYHCVANKPPNPGRHRMLYETERGRRRLYRSSDHKHPNRTGKVLPDSEAIPAKYHYLLKWYQTTYDPPRQEVWLGDALQLAGAAKGVYGDADKYVRRLREGWQ